MYKKCFILFLIVLLIINISGCTNKSEEKPQLLFYIGITMVKPVQQLVEEFKKEHNCDIIIIQGGSQDLYDSLKRSNKGDLYMPGSYSYRKNNLEDGLLKNAVLVGYNKAALMVSKGNPLGFTNSLSQLSDSNYRIVICSPDSGSIGYETKKILSAYGNFNEVFENSIYLTSDSRNLTDAIIDGEADICINWYATTVWKDSHDLVDAIIIDEKYANKKMLLMNLTSCSKHPKLTKEFMAYASSKHGRQVFMEYGFIDELDMKNIDGVEYK